MRVPREEAGQFVIENSNLPDSGCQSHLLNSQPFFDGERPAPCGNEGEIVAARFLDRQGLQQDAEILVAARLDME